MFRSIQLFRVLGIPVRVHGTLPYFVLLASWFFNSAGSLAGFLGAALFIIAVLGFVLLHELGHCVAAKYFGIRTRQILLTPIGGIAALEAIPRRPFHEFVVAVAGPLVNFVLFGLLGFGALVAAVLSVSPELLLRLAFVNLILGTFNLLPGFPLDGGRIFRSLLALRLPYLRATEIATRVGQVVAVILGLVGLTWGHPGLVLIAVFVFFAAQAELVAVRARFHPMGALGGLVERLLRQSAAGRNPGETVFDPRGFAPPDDLDRGAGSTSEDATERPGETIIDVGPDGKPRRVWRRGRESPLDDNEPGGASESGAGSHGSRVFVWRWRSSPRK